MNKRVHEIAKERGVPSRAVLERLRAAGVEVKAASSSVDEALASRVLDGVTQDGGRDGAPESASAAPAARETGGDKPEEQSAPPQAASRPEATRDAATAGPARQQAPGGPSRPQTDSGGARPQPQPEAPRTQASSDAGRQYKRPTRDSLQGERAPGSAGGRRRVVIDSQASRRTPGGAPTIQPPRQDFAARRDPRDRSGRG